MTEKTTATTAATTAAAEKKLRSVVKAAAFLQQCFPPHRQAAAARTLAKLGGPRPSPQLLELLLEGSTQRLSPVACPNPKCGRHFLFSEANRDGDAYRCVWCSKLVAGDGSYAPPAVPLPRALRSLEKTLNVGFIDYTRAYFGEHALANCYVGVGADNGGGSSSSVSVSVLIRKVVEAAPDADESCSLAGSVWNSTHVMSLRLDRDYQVDVVGANSTVYIESQAKPCRFSGHISRPTPKFAVPVPPGALHAQFEAARGDLLAFVSNSSSDGGAEQLAAARQLLVTTVGDLVQRSENRLRDVVASVYFGKSAQVGTDLRCPVGRTDHSATKMSTGTAVPSFKNVDASGAPMVPTTMAAAAGAVPSVSSAAAAAAAATASAKPKMPVAATVAPSSESVDDGAGAESVWEPVQDENGDTFYVNEATGETEWELPEGAVLKKKKSKKSKKQKQQEEEEAAAAAAAAAAAEAEADAAEGEEEWSIASVLSALELGGDIDEYVSLLGEAGIGSVEELLTCDAEFLKATVGISSKSDVKKISKEINRLYEEAAGGEE